MGRRGVPRLLMFQSLFCREDEVHSSDALRGRLLVVEVRISQEFLIVQMVSLRKGRRMRGGTSANLD